MLSQGKEFDDFAKSLCSIVWDPNCEASHLNTVFPLISIPFILNKQFLGALTVFLWWWVPEVYGVWYYLLQGIVASLVGVLGMVAGIQYSKKLTIAFGALLILRYIYYIVVEFLLLQRGTNLQFELPWWWAIPVALIKIVYGVRTFRLIPILIQSISDT